MLPQRKIIVSLALVLLPAFAAASPLVYVVTSAQQFGTVDLASGAFHQIGPDTPEGNGGLVTGPNGSLLAVTFSGKLDSINPSTGGTSVVGRTGFADCTLPTSPCGGPTSLGALGQLGGTIYGTDFSGNLYTVTPSTGTTTLIGPTGIPAVPAIPFTTNPDGSLNVYTESLFGSGGKLYATFDADTLDPVTFVPTPLILPHLYQINPLTGFATVLAPTTLGLGTAVDVNGTVYAFDIPTGEVVTLNLTNGKTSFVSNLDPAAGMIGGASLAPVPEPASIALAGVGMVVILVSRLKRRGCKFYVLASFALGAATNLLAADPVFTQIDFPGAASTQAWGITASGDIVGGFASADKSTHGFLRTRGEFISIDFPGAAYTYLNGISPRGDLIGDYAASLDGSGPHHGFVLSRDGLFSTVDFPGALSSFAIGMNSRGDVLGSYSNADNLLHTFVMNADPFSPGGQFKAIDDPPGAPMTVAIGIRGDDIVGGYPLGTERHGFLLADGKYTVIDVPGASFTNVTSIDARGQMVGRYTLNGVTHAYLRSGGQITSFDFPGAAFTGATAISSNGDILGRFRDANNVFHGFLLTGFQPANTCPSGN